MALDRLTKVDGGGISTTSDYRVGIITASKFVGPFDGTGGNFTGVITATSANFSGNVTIGGTLTYEDVTNIDSVGIITAQKDIHVGAGVSAVGVGTFSGLDISGDIDVDGHTNLDNVSIAGVTTITGSGNALEIVGGVVRNRGTTSARFVVNNGSAEGYFGWTSGALTVGQAAATLSLEATGSNHIQLKTNGDERLRITGAGLVGIGTNVGLSDILTVNDTNPKISMRDGGVERAFLHIDGSDDFIINNKSISNLILKTTDEERLRITSGGNVGINESANINGRLHIQHDALEENILYASRYNQQSDDKPVFAVTQAQMTNMSAAGLVIGNHNMDIHLGPVYGANAGVSTHVTKGIRIGAGYGQVGINTNVFSQAYSALTVKNAVSIDFDTVLDIVADDDKVSRLEFSETSNSGKGSIRYSYASDANFMSFHTNGTTTNDTNERLRIDSVGRVSIGDNNTQTAYPFYVAKDLNTGGNLLSFGNTDSTYSQGLTLSFDSNKDVKWAGGSGSGGLIWDMGTRGYQFKINGSDRLRITSGGQVNIGGNYTQTTNQLHVIAPTGKNAIGFGATTQGMKLGWDGDNSSYDDVRIYQVDYNNSGTYGIAGNNPTTVIQSDSVPGSGTVNSTVWLKRNNSGNLAGRNIMNVCVDGDVTIGGAGEENGASITGVQGSKQTGFGVSKLTIQPDDRTTAFSASDGDTWHDVVIKQRGGATNNAAGIAFQVADENYHKNAGTGICAVKNGTNADYGSDLAFITRPQSAVAQERLRITSGGSILIDTTVTTEASADGNDLIIGSTSDTQKGISIVGSTTNGIGNIFFTDGASYKNQGLIQYRHSDDSMRFTTAQNEALCINSSRSVIIGGGVTYGAAGTFSVGSTGTLRQVLSSGTAQDTLLNAISGVSNGFQLTTDASNNQTYKFHNGSSVSVTITSGLLNVKGSAVLDDGTNARITLQADGTSTNQILSTTTNFGSYCNMSYQAADHIFKYGGTQNFRVMNNGKILCGVGNYTGSGYPSVLQIQGDSQLLDLNTTSSDPAIIYFYEQGVGRFRIQARAVDGFKIRDTLNSSDKISIHMNGDIRLDGGTAGGHDSSLDVRQATGRPPFNLGFVDGSFYRNLGTEGPRDSDGINNQSGRRYLHVRFRTPWNDYGMTMFRVTGYFSYSDYTESYVGMYRYGNAGYRTNPYGLVTHNQKRNTVVAAYNTTADPGYLVIVCDWSTDYMGLMFEHIGAGDQYGSYMDPDLEIIDSKRSTGTSDPGGWS